MGARRLREFFAAPETTQAEFTRRLAAQVEADLEFDRYVAESHDDDPTPPAPPAVKLPRRRLVWDETWAKRARIARRPQRPGQRDYQTERDRLVAIEARDYVSALTGRDVDAGKVPCVLPDHDERTASFVVYPGDGGWYCYGCHRGGGIYDLAAALWDLSTRGRDFVELHERLCEQMGVA